MPTLQPGFGPYDPCPCGSGKKYKFCCAQEAKSLRHGKYPTGTVAFYGPDDQTVTKVTAGVILRDGADPILQRWTGDNVKDDPKVADEMRKFFAKWGVKNVVASDGIIGCPHEEGIDFRAGTECPFCPFWEGKQGIILDEDDWEIEDPSLDQDPDDAGPASHEINVVVRNDEADDDEADDDGRDPDDAIARFDRIAGDKTTTRDAAIKKILAHLAANLQLPCQVTGQEDFQWEEPYVLGGFSQKEYNRLKQTQPSYTDQFEMLGLAPGQDSQWMMFPGEDIPVLVRRISDGKKFVLGLAEVEPTDKKSANYRLIVDYSIWFVNTR